MDSNHTRSRVDGIARTEPERPPSDGSPTPESEFDREDADAESALRRGLEPVQVERPDDGAFEELYVLRDPDGDDHLVFVLTADGGVHHVATFDPVALGDA